MVKFTVEKKNIESATSLLNVVAGLKSVGATPSESSGITLTPGIVMLSNMNESNGIFISSIPIAVTEGEIASHLESTYMVNSKKLDSIVRGSGKEVVFSIMEDKIIIGEGKRVYELALYKVPRKEIPETQELGHTVVLDKVLVNMSNSDAVTKNIINRADLAGTMFTAGGMLASDKISALHIKNSNLFENAEHQDMIITTDLFAACASKIKQANAMPAITTDGKRFVLLFDNIVLCKSIRTEKFPIVGIRTAISKSQEALDGKVPNITAKISVSDFNNKLKEIRSIVESEEYILELNPTHISIKSSNSQQGTGGEEIVDAEVKFSGIEIPSIASKFSFVHLELIGKLYSAKEDIVLIARIEGIEGIGKKPVISSIAIMGEEQSFVFLPKSSV